MVSKKILLVVSLSLLLLVTGCINISVDQKFKRNGHYDLGLTISTSPEYKMVLNGLKEGFQVEDSVKDKFEYMETDNSITYSFKDLDPKVDQKLFKKVETDEIQEEDALVQDTGAFDPSFLDPSNGHVDVEFKFPYFVYTYTFKMASDSSDASTAVLSQEEYILDEANILDEESKSQIIDSINNVYKNDSVEIIVVTKEQMDEIYYHSFIYDLTNDFNFKGETKQYILIFISTGAAGKCAIESNIYLDPPVSSMIETLNTGFEENCRAGYSVQTLNVVKQIDEFFKVNDMDASLQMTEQLEQLFKIRYTVEVFGKITDTNGMKSGDNTVTFDVSASENKEYTLVFKDFFLASILGDLYWVYLIIFGVIILIIIGVIISKHRPSAESMPLEAPIAIDPQVMDYIRRARQRGIPDPQIKDSLMRVGWGSKEIDVALRLK